ncbi:MAG: hypothetical protein AB7J19_16120 [Beijerinckiaceae bacterium]
MRFLLEALQERWLLPAALESRPRRPMDGVAAAAVVAALSRGLPETVELGAMPAAAAAAAVGAETDSPAGQAVLAGAAR